jgi:Transposase
VRTAARAGGGAAPACRGLWVESLVAAGYQVFAVYPLAVARYRDRHQVSGAKSDAGDAKVGDSVRSRSSGAALRGVIERIR